MTITIPGQNIKMDTESGIDPIWYDKLKMLFEQSGGALETSTFTGGASFSSTSSWTNFSHVRIVISNLSASMGANTPLLRYHANGAYQNADYISAASTMSLSGGAPFFNAPITSINSIVLIGANNLNIGAIAEGVSIDATIYNVNSTTIAKYIKSLSVFHAGGNAFIGEGSGIWTGGNFAIDGFQVFFGAGANLAAGKIQVYGLT